MIKLDEYFTLKYGTCLAFESLELDDSNQGINFISRISSNNGFVAKIRKVKNIQPNPKNTISCVLNGYAVLECFLQKEEWYSSYHVMYLTPKINLSEKQMLYYCMIIKANKYKYSFGRQANKTLKDILIPSIDKIPDYVEQTKLPTKPTEKSVISQKLELDIKDWQDFKIGDLFEIEKGKENNLQDIVDTGDIPVISATDSNNGIVKKINKSNVVKMFNKNCLTTMSNAIPGRTFYQNSDFAATADINVCIPKFKMNQYIAIFLVKIFNMEEYRFNYGRKFGQDRMRSHTIKLPAIESKPNWQFMEDYIKSLKYSNELCS